jgi:hypothetical protein
MTASLSLIGRKGQMSGLRTALDLGGAGLLFYPNLPPAEPDIATGELLLATLTLASPCGALGQSGTAPDPLFATLTITTPRVAAVSATGVVGWVRFVNGAGDGFLDLLAGLPGSGAPVIVSVLQVFQNGELQLLSCTLRA